MCMSCSFGKYSAGTGKTDESTCLRCTPGTFAPTSEMSSCTLCSAGTYGIDSGMSACSRCLVGTYQPSKGVTLCLDCLAGSFQGSEGMPNCSVCGTGAYQDGQGQSRCELCSAGYYQNRTNQTVCAACSPGSARASAGGGVCDACEIGKAQGLGGQTACRTCEAGQHQPARSAAACIGCPAGKFNGWNASEWERSGAPPNCSSCGAGTYAGSVGQSGCAQCEEDRYQNATGQSACLNCTGGNHSGPGQTACSSCLAGYYEDWVWMRGCLPCPPGAYQAGPGRSVCSLCPAGRFNAGNTSRTLDDCAKCGFGKYAPIAGLAACPYCAVGTFQTGLGTTVCALCGAGSYTSVAGVISGCQGCAAGLFQESNASTNCLECTPCGAGAFRRAGCNGTRDAECQNCSVCVGGVARGCGLASDTVCGGVEQCPANRTSAMRLFAWILADKGGKYRCSTGQYLWGLDARQVPAIKTCLPCPGGWVGLNGVFCERCLGPLLEPYYVDGSSCVCKAPSVMNATGGCQCPDGHEVGGGSCVPCQRDAYGVGGVCRACGAGDTTLDRTGATACVACEFGQYRTAGSWAGGCRNCSLAGWYAPNRTVGDCVSCNRTCAVSGLRWARFCPGDAGYSVCEACPGGLPAGATWLNVTADPLAQHRALEECAFDCGAGFYRQEGGGCQACERNRTCAAGWRLTGCTQWSNSHCDVACADDERKPQIYSRWLAGNDCQWACDAGRELVQSDYVLFTVWECV